MISSSTIRYALAFIAALALFYGAARVVAGDIEAGRRKAERCATCHGADGNGVSPGMPSIAGMGAFYTHWQLIMFRDGRRLDRDMAPFVQNLTDADLGDLAAYYAAQAPQRRSATIDPAKAAAGRPVAHAQNCTSCHGPSLMGRLNVPRLAGQDFDYLAKRLRGYKTKRTSDPTP